MTDERGLSLLQLGDIPPFAPPWPGRRHSRHSLIEIDVIAYI